MGRECVATAAPFCEVTRSRHLASAVAPSRVDDVADNHLIRLAEPGSAADIFTAHIAAAVVIVVFKRRQWITLNEVPVDYQLEYYCDECDRRALLGVHS